MPTAPAAFQEIDIEPVRADAVRVTRGFFAIAFGPLYLVLTMLISMAGDLPNINATALKDPILWIAMLAAAAGFAVTRLYSTAFDARALKVMLAGSWVLVTLTIAFVLVKLADEGWALDGSSVMATTAMAVPLITILGVMLYWLVLTPCLSALRLLGGRLPGTRVPLVDVIGPLTVRRTRTNDAPADVKPNLISRSLKIAAAVVGLGGSAAIVWFLGQEELTAAAAAEVGTLVAATATWRFARRYEAVDARTLLSLDERPPILFLRSFQDDTKGLGQEWDMIGRSSWLKRILRLGRPLSRLAAKAGGRHAVAGLRLEETLAQTVKALGPFVGIGAPGEHLPELGASRAYFSNDTWQNAIIGWVDAAQLIVKIAGPTRWIRWELDTILHRQAWPRLLILFPQGSEADRAARWANIGAELVDTPWGYAYASIDPSRVIGMRLLEGGRIAVVTSDSRRVIDFLIAVRIMLRQMRASI